MPAVVVPLRERGASQRVRVGDDLVRLVADVHGGVALRVGVAGGAGGLVVVHAARQDAVRPDAPQYTALPVVDVAVRGAVAVRPRRDAVLRVVPVTHGLVGRVEDLRQVAGGVVGVGDERGAVLAPCAVQEAQGGDPRYPGIGVDGDAVAAGVPDLLRCALGVVDDVDAVAVAVAVPVGDRGQRQLAAAHGQRGEVERAVAVRDDDAHGAGRVAVPVQRPTGPRGGERGLPGRRHRVRQQHATVCDVDDALAVDLQPLVERARPGGAEPAPARVPRDVVPLQDHRKGAGQRDVGGGHEHFARRHVDRLTGRRALLVGRGVPVRVAVRPRAGAAVPAQALHPAAQALRGVLGDGGPAPRRAGAAGGEGEEDLGRQQTGRPGRVALPFVPVDDGLGELLGVLHGVRRAVHHARKVQPEAVRAVVHEVVEPLVPAAHGVARAAEEVSGPLLELVPSLAGRRLVGGFLRGVVELALGRDDDGVELALQLVQAAVAVLQRGEARIVVRRTLRQRVFLAFQGGVVVRDPLPVLLEVARASSASSMIGLTRVWTERSVYA